MAVTKLHPASSDSSDSDSDSETPILRKEDEKKTSKPVSESESDSESESESETEKSNATPPTAGFAVKPVVPKSNPKRKTPDGGEEASSSEEQEKKRQKTVVSRPPTTPSHGGSARLWSDEDEIAILQGLLDYRSETRSDPHSDAVGFHGFASSRLSVEASKSQLSEKIRRLKQKYLVTAVDGGPAPSSKPHDLRRYELSKKVWGVGAQNQSATKTVTVTATKTKTATATKRSKKKVDAVDYRAEYPSMFESVRRLSEPMGTEYLVKKMEDSMLLIRSSKAKQLEMKWKKLEAEEVELRVQRSELARQTYQLILDAIKPDSN